MRLRDIIPDSTTVNSLEVEELAAGVLGHLIWLVNNDDGYKRNTLHVMNYCMAESKGYEERGQPKCAEALAEAWEYLRTTGMLARNIDQTADFTFLTRKARAMKSTEDYEHFKKASLYPRSSIHPVIAAETYAEFLRGDYETAVFKAFKAVEVAVRKHSGAKPETIGVDLMTKAFNPDTGPMRDASEVRAEQKSLMDLYCGAIGRFKNPSSHREVNIDNASEAIEILQLASLLMRIIDRRAAAVASGGVRN